MRRSQMSINKEELDKQFKKILEARDKICDEFCRISPKELKNVCENRCPLNDEEGRKE